MANYQLTATDAQVIRTNKNERHPGPDYIPNDPLNKDWVEYQAWIAEGNIPDPYVAPTLPEEDAPVEHVVLYDHENRIRSLEGTPAMSRKEFDEAVLKKPKTATAAATKPVTKKRTKKVARKKR